MELSNNDVIIHELVDSYFTEYSINSLTMTFDKCLREIIMRLDSITATDHSSQIIKIVMAFLLSTLVEHGEMSDFRRYTMFTAQETIAKLCYIPGFPSFCQNLGGPDDYLNWTHMMLYLIQAIRSGKFPQIENNSAQTIPLDLSNVNKEFASNAIMFLYAVILLRLSLSAQRVPGVDARYNIEACLFATIICFYSDYILVKKSLLKPTQKNWDTLYKQIQDYYMKPGKFFITLRLKYDKEAYLDQDNTTAIQGCIVKNFIDKHKKNLVQNIGSPEIFTAMTCLHNMDLNAMSKRFNRWFRNLVNHRVTQNLGHAVKYGSNFAKDLYGMTTASAKGLGNAYTFGQDAFNVIYSKNYPKMSGTAGVIVAIVAFTGKSLTSLTLQIASDAFKDIRTATVYAFNKKEILPDRPIFTMKIVKPKRSAYLVWEKSRDGKYSVIYNFSPTPLIVEQKDEPVVFNQQGGSKADIDIETLRKALRKGYMRYELPIEMQLYIKKKLSLTTVMTGGSSEKSDLDVSTEDDYEKLIISEADEVAFFREDDDQKTLQLVIPKPKLEQEALENAIFVDVPEPISAIEITQENLSRLPASVPEKSEQRPEVVDTKPIYSNVPPPPFIQFTKVYYRKPKRKSRVSNKKRSLKKKSSRLYRKRSSIKKKSSRKYKTKSSLQKKRKSIKKQSLKKSLKISLKR